MRDQEGFDKAITELFDKFSEELATLRVYFGMKGAVVTADVQVMGGRLFEPKQLVCPYENLPDFITEKVSMLKIAGRGVVIQDVGEWKKDFNDDKMFYVKATPKQWNEFAKDRV